MPKLDSTNPPTRRPRVRIPELVFVVLRSLNTHVGVVSHTLAHIFRYARGGQNSTECLGHISSTQIISHKVRLRIFLTVYGFTLYYVLDKLGM